MEDVKEPKVLGNRQSGESRLFELYPRLHPNTRIKPQKLRLADGRIVNLVPWNGDVSEYAVLVEPTLSNSPRELCSLYCDQPLCDADLSAIQRALQKQMRCELYVIVPRLYSIHEYGYALVAERVVAPSGPIKNGPVIHCTNNKTLTQAKSFVLAKDKSDALRAYHNHYSGLDLQCKRMNQVGQRSVDDRAMLQLKDLFKLAMD